MTMKRTGLDRPIVTTMNDRSSDALVNLNTASQDDLDAIEGLKGHGFEIVRYREERGHFTALRQLDEVPGLSGKAGDDVRARLTV